MAKINETLIQAKQIADTMDNLVLKSIILDLQSQVLDLQQENIGLKESQATRESYNMRFEHGVYWNVKEDGRLEGPFCPICWDDKKKAIRMHENFVGVWVEGARANRYKCNLCQTSVRK